MAKSIAEEYRRILAEGAKEEQDKNIDHEYSDEETNDLGEEAEKRKQGDEEGDVPEETKDGSPTDSTFKKKVDGEKSSQEKTELSDESTKIDDSQDHVKDVDKAEDAVNEEEDEEDDDGEGEGDGGEDEDEDVNEHFDLDLSEDVDALFNGESLSESFKGKATNIFEAAVRNHVKDQVAVIKEQHKVKLAEAREEIFENIAEHVDGFLNHVVAEWAEENRLAIERGVRGEIAESLITQLKGVLSEHHIDLPEEREDLVEKMIGDIEQLETKLDEQIEKNISLSKQINETARGRVFDRVSKNLTETQKEKLEKLAEGVEFKGEADYESRLQGLKENYFDKKAAVLEEEVGVETPEVDPLLAESMAYMSKKK